MSLRLVVRESDPRTLRDLLAAHGVADTAIAEGRVFAAGKRAADPTLAVATGDELVVEDARPATGAVHVLSEYRSLYAVSKPSGLPTEPDRSGHSSVVHALAKELGVPVDVLHAVTRLDAPVSGVVIVARGAEAARTAAELRQRGELRRRYVALAARAVEPSRGTWDAKLPDGARGRGARSASKEREATTRYAVVAAVHALPSAPPPALYVMEPVTGRMHQIRIHAAGAGAPLLGDAKYGGPRRAVLPDGRVLTFPRVALHAARVEVLEGGAVRWHATAPLADDLAVVWSALGGDPSDPDRALALPPLDRP